MPLVNGILRNTAAFCNFEGRPAPAAAKRLGCGWQGGCPKLEAGPRVVVLQILELCEPVYVCTYNIYIYREREISVHMTVCMYACMNAAWYVHIYICMHARISTVACKCVLGFTYRPFPLMKDLCCSDAGVCTRFSYPYTTYIRMVSVQYRPRQ